MGHLVYIFWALWNNLWRLKGVSIFNRLRLWRKSCNLYLAFLAFMDAKRPWSQRKNAMISAILTAVYDYDTDWVKTADPEKSIFFRELRRLLRGHPKENDAIRIAEDLFRQDWGGKLSAHGLERGSASFRFYCLVIGSFWLSRYSEEEINNFGRKLQIVDDILDWKKDTKNGDHNCFNTPERDAYLKEAGEFIYGLFFYNLTDRSWVYRAIKKKCWHNAKEINCSRNSSAPAVP